MVYIVTVRKSVLERYAVHARSKKDAAECYEEGDYLSQEPDDYGTVVSVTREESKKKG